MPGMFDWLYKPLTDAPTRITRKLSQAVDPIEPMQQTGQGGLRDWAAWADASAKGLLQGSGEAAGQMLSDMTSPFSIGMTALGGKGLQRIGSTARMARNAMRAAPELASEASTIGRLGAEFAPVGSEAAVNTAKASNVLQEAKTMKGVARQGAVNEHPITMKNEDALYRDMNPAKRLPQVEDAYTSGRGTSVYKPEVSKEMGRLMVDMMDEGTMKDAFTIAHSKYPRMLGHIGEISTDVPYKGIQGLTVAGDARRAADASGKITNIRINPNSMMTQTGQDMAGAVAHEMAHGAQRLRMGGDKFRQTYDAARGVAKSGIGKELEYLRNPMEVQARRSGRKFAKYATRSE